uniref:XK-related protein n=1 Tax=Anopheles albimanus TaxID=7167 RepID=A0A182FBS9_ANOAL
MAEFLPLCDVLFNVISLAGYFCDVVFDVVLGYALYERQKFAYFTAVIVIVSFSLVISQIVSIRWYLNKRKIRNATASTAGPPVTADDTPGGTPAVNSLEKKKKKTSSDLGLAGTGTDRSAQYSRYIVLALHVTQLGVLWRYAKLFVPVDLRHVKHEVRDLCMLRLVHAFCEAAPMLLLQLYVLVNLQSEAQLSALKLKTLGHHHLLPAGASATTALVQQTNLVEQQQKTFRDLNMVSATLSLFSVCWALASFSKNVRLQNVHRLVLTWLGVIFQFLWRLGTVISRVISLTVYASVYSHWVFLVIILHWFSMFLWLISPKNVFHGERISRLKKTTLGGLIAFVYIFAYINLQEVRHRQKMLTFYVVMFMENCLLVCLWMVGVWPNRPDGWYMIPVSVLCSFAAGLFFMVVYYRYFHVRRLGYEAGGRLAEKCSAHCPDGCRCPISHDVNGLDSASGGANGAGNGVAGGKLTNGGLGNCGVGGGQKYPHAIPGVFNCRFSNPVNAATKRKKKKPTTFVPPPNLGVTSANAVAGGTAGSAIDQYNLNHQHHHQQQQQQHHQQQQQQLLHQQFQQHQQQQQMQHQHHQQQQQQHQPQLSTSNSNSTHSMGPMAIPFWRRPLPRSHTGGSSENEGSSVGSRVNIQQKLLEKKQKQLAELKIIEEEIKQGKLGGPGAGATGTLSSGDDGKTTLPRQPIPRAKKHIDLDPIEWRTSSPDMAEIVANKSFNDLNLLLAANLDDVNGLGKFSSNYDPIYNSFGLNGINISALVNLKGNGAAAAVAAATAASAGPTPTLVDARDCQPPTSSVLQGARNMSPISSQISATESNSLTRHHQVPVVPRSKMILPSNIPRNPFAENYRGNFVNLYADAAANGNASSAVTACSANACQVNGGGAGNGNGTTVRAPSISPRTTEIAQSNRAILYDAHGRLYTDANHPRQVSGTYSNSNADNAGNTDNLPFPYNVVPPPRSKLDSRGTPSTPAQSGSASGSANNTNSSNKSARTATTATMVAVAACVGAGTSGGTGSGPVANQSGPSVPINNLNNTKRQNMQRAKTPEILLAPHYLENSRIYFDWVAREAANFRLQDPDRDHHPVESSGDENLDNSACDDGHGGHHRIPSDIDSQVSLPRSYTLPREFKYYRRNKGRKVKNEHFIASTNSSDGDVDSGDDNESERLSSNLSSSSQRRQKNATPCSNLVVVGSGQHHVVSLQSTTTQQQQQHVNPHQRLNNLNKAGAAAALLSQSGVVGLKDTGGSPVAHQLYGGHGGSPSNTLLTASGRQSLNATPQNLHHQPLTAQQGPGGGGPSSYNLRTTSPGAMPVLPPNGVPGPLATKIAVHNLDLISGVEALAGGNGGAMVPPYHGGGGGRPMRFRMYGGTKNGMVRHETKL